MGKVAPVLMCMGVAGLLLAGLSVGSGCSSTSASTVPLDGQAFCYATPQESAGAPCQVEGQVCTPSYYSCGGFQQLATCTCAGGVFQCTDSTGGPFPTDGGAPNCVEGDGGSSACPDPRSSNAAQTEFKPCTKPGLICYFPTNCPPSQGIIPPDVCQCVGNGSGGLEYVCDPGCGQLGDGAVSDAYFQPDTFVGGDDASDGSTTDAPSE
jgi:hypothetical protein